MVIDIEKHTVIGLNDAETKLFSVMLHLAMKRLTEWKQSSQDQHFRIIGEEITSFEEEKLFIEDLMRGIIK